MRRTLHSARSLTRRAGLAFGALVVAWPAPAPSELAPDIGYALVRDLMAPEKKVRAAAQKRLIDSGDRRFLVPLVDALFFTPALARGHALDTLVRMSGHQGGERYYDWVEYVGGAGLEPPPDYLRWKRELLERIDRRYRDVFYDGAPALIRLEEIVWGGVRLDGIPALEQPQHAAAQDARGLDDRDRVFGVTLNGEARAYPVKILSWHEMANDTVGGEPVVLSYCTLCGSGILYHTRTPSGGAYTFGTSGLLYRSNKLMYDRQSLSLWSNLTGEAVVGRKAQVKARLTMLPMTLTTWRAWRTAHPETTVVQADPELERRHGFSYQEGAADRARAGVSFPVWRKSAALDDQAEVFTLRHEGKAKAWSLERLARAGLHNDTVGAFPVVLLAEGEGGGARAYQRRDHTLERESTSRGNGRLLDERGVAWTVTEEALTAPGEEPLPRVAGHVAFWFGWFGFYPDTEVW